MRADLLDEVMVRAVDLFHESRRTRAAAGRGGPRLSRHLDRTEFRIRELYTRLSELRLVPLDTLCLRVKQTARELSRDLAKPVRVSIEGGEILVDRSIVDALSDPLQHMVRNALDHGIESRAEREAAGKPAEASLVLHVTRRGGLLTLALEDDGRGLDAGALRRAAVARGTVDGQRAAEMSDAEAYLLSTVPSLSTVDRPTRVSGRGVGMDVVRRSVEQLGGSLSLSSQPGCWTRVELRLPATAALIQALLLRSGEDLFAMPVSRVRTTLDWRCGAHPGAEEVPDGAPGALRVVRLDAWLGLPPADEPRGNLTALLLDLEDRNVGLVVDEVLGRRDLLVRPLGAPLSSMAPYSGAALLDDGSVALVLDVERLAALRREDGAPRAPA